MWPRDAYVGQRVVCVSDDWGPYAARSEQRGTKLPSVNRVYTIRAIELVGGEIGLYFVELINPKIAMNGTEQCFIAANFKPVDESRLDVFREMLKNVPNRKDVVRPETV